MIIWEVWAVPSDWFRKAGATERRICVCENQTDARKIANHLYTEDMKYDVRWVE